MESLLVKLEEERDYLIAELGSTFEHDELLKQTGRLYELTKIINKIKELAGEQR